MPKLCQSDDAFNGSISWIDSDAAARAGSRASSTLFPYPYRRNNWQTPAHGNRLRQVLHNNLPAGDWAKGGARHRLLADRVAEFQEGVGKAIEYGGARCNAARSIASPASAPAGIDPTKLRETFVRNLQFAAASSRRRAFASDRAVQNAGHSALREAVQQALDQSRRGWIR